MIALRARGLYQLHASAAVDPNGIAFLFAGPSGVGKSTLAYALSRQGWRILGDDGVVLEPTPGWREASRVARATAGEQRARARVSGVARPAAFRECERSPPSHPHAALAAHHAPLGAIIFPRRAAGDRLSPMSQTMALAELIVQSTQVLLADSETPRHFARLRHVVATVPSFRLEHTQKQLHAIALTLRDVAR